MLPFLPIIRINLLSAI